MPDKLDPDLMFETKEDAEAVRHALRSVLDRYEIVTVADYLEIAGRTPDHFSQFKVGWTELGKMPIKPLSGGFLVELPEPKPI